MSAGARTDKEQKERPVMSDLVQRIRDRPNDAPMPTERLLDEAADEIERLEAALIMVLEPRAGDVEDGASVLIRHRHAAKQWNLIRTEFPDNGVKYTIRRKTS